MAEQKLISMKTGTDTFASEDGKTEQRDDYPWGLMVTLNDEVIKRLGLATLPNVGDEMMMIAKVRFISTSTHETGTEMRQDACMQITDMALNSTAPEPQRSAASVMYGPADRGDA